MVVKITGNFAGPFYSQVMKNIDALPKTYQSEYKKRSLRPIQNLRKRLKREPSRLPSHPFVWSHDSAAQGRARRWWFAAVAGRIPGVTIPTSGGRYKRTGEGVKGIRVITDRPNGEINIFIPSGMDYVVGRKQVPSHEATGWKNIPEELKKAEVEFLDNAITVWVDLTERLGE